MPVTWKITRMIVAPSPEPQTIVRLAYEARLDDLTYGGEIPLDPPGEDFTPFASLTESQALDWLWGKVGKDVIEQILTERAAQSEAAPPWGV